MPAHGPTVSPLAIALFNDTGDNAHVGCLAVSEAHRHMLRRAGAHVRHAYFCCEWHPLGAGGLAEGIDAALANDVLRGAFDDVDAVVVNGEGTVHHGYGRHLIAILGAAQRLGIPTFLVNAVLQDCGDAREVLSSLDDCTVRDGCTSRYLETLGVRHRLIPDSFFEAPFVGVPIHDFAGKLVVTDCHPAKGGWTFQK